MWGNTSLTKAYGLKEDLARYLLDPESRFLGHHSDLQPLLHFMLAILSTHCSSKVSSSISSTYSKTAELQRHHESISLFGGGGSGGGGGHLALHLR